MFSSVTSYGSGSGNKSSCTGFSRSPARIVVSLFPASLSGLSETMHRIRLSFLVSGATCFGQDRIMSASGGAILAPGLSSNIDKIIENLKKAGYTIPKDVNAIRSQYDTLEIKCSGPLSELSLSEIPDLDFRI
ncbi:MAG: hypothetical protein OXC68_12675 [Aestuariivita sp.]|nr:hypothetical protein [Aestuariivita sp.]